MAQIDEKLIHFTQLLIEEAQVENSRLEAEILAGRDAALHQVRRQSLEQAQRYEREEIAKLKGQTGREISRRMQENKRTLYLRREEIANDVFHRVREKIVAFTQTSEYQDRLCAIFTEALGQLGDCSAVVCMLRPADTALRSRLSTLCGNGRTLSFREGEFDLGGLILETGDIRLDATFDAALDELNGHFAEQFGLSLSE